MTTPAPTTPAARHNWLYPTTSTTPPFFPRRRARPAPLTAKQIAGVAFASAMWRGTQGERTFFAFVYAFVWLAPYLAWILGALVVSVLVVANLVTIMTTLAVLIAVFLFGVSPLCTPTVKWVRRSVSRRSPR